VPCVIEFEIPVVQVSFPNVAESVIRQYVAHEGIYGESKDEDLCVRGGIAAHDILRIYRRGDGEFERLTLCDRWRRCRI
jgi:hypothetical protein